jgi:Fe-S cluster assembly protein SufD
MPLPSEKEEVWRYSPIDALDLDAYRPAVPAGGGEVPAGARELVASLSADIGSPFRVVTVVDGRVVDGAAPGEAGGPGGKAAVGPVGPVGIGGLVGGATCDAYGAVLDGDDALVRLNDAFHPDAVVVDVPDGTDVGSPIVVVHWCSGAADPGPALASFPRTVVRVGAGSRASVVEVVAGAPGGHAALVVPVSELDVRDGAHLSFVSLQVLGTGAWHVARLAARAGRDATLRTFTVGLGGSYDRTRTDAVAGGPGSHTELRSAYLGVGDQVHDIRTLQDHVAPHTTSDLLCKGAVADSSRSVYSGLIRVRRGAAGASAMQTNHNLVLDERAHADSVPNLDIEENDVRCSHASTVGPIDPDQLYYLESRGIPPERAERLVVLGFFDDIVDRSPVPEFGGRLHREVGTRLAGVVRGIGGDGSRG